MRKTYVALVLLGLAGCEIVVPPLVRPSVFSSTPADAAQNVAPGAAVKLELELPNGGVSVISANPNSVTLTDVATGQSVPATIRVDNDSERLTLTPSGNL